MRVLGIDTAGSSGGLALVSGGEVRGTADLGAPGGYAERILEGIERLLAGLALAPGEIDLVAVTVGPGSFTGLRIGMAAAQGLALGIGRPVVGVLSHRVLAAWAAQVTEGQGELYVPLIDARRGEVYHAAYRPAGGGAENPAVGGLVEIVPPGAARPADLRGALGLAPAARRGEGPKLVLTGDGVAAAAAELAVWPETVTTIFPPRGADAARLTAELGRLKFEAEGAPAVLEPLYIRPADARKPGRPPGGRRADVPAGPDEPKK